jgi:hypothetical protein
VAAPHTETMTAADLAATVRDALDRWTQGYHVQIADMPKIAQARAALAELQAQAERTKLADYRETHEELTARAEAAEAKVAVQAASASGGETVTEDERLERIDRAFSYVPLGLYDEITKLAEAALGEFISDRDRLREELEWVGALNKANIENANRLRETAAEMERALLRTQAIAMRGVGPDTTPEEALATIAAYVEKRLNAITAAQREGLE